MSSATAATLNTLAAATEYVRRGLAVVPIPTREKGPRLSGWQNLRLNEVDLPRYFHPGDNVGVLLGEASGLVDIDLDCPEARNLASVFLPLTHLIHGRPGNPSSHFWYRVSEPPKHCKFNDPRLEKSDPKSCTLVELRSDGHQTLVPPSVHPSGERLSWERNGDAATVEATLLSGAVRSLASAALLARYWPAPGARHEAAMALAGMLLSGGWEEDSAVNFVVAVAEATGDEEARRRARDVISTAKRLIDGRNATGGKTLATFVGDEVVARVREWLDLQRHVPAVSSTVDFPGQNKWPDPLGSEAWHGLAGEIVRTVEPHTEADSAALLLQFLVATGSAIGRKPFFTVEQHHHHVNLFTVIVGLTSKSRKGTSWSRIVSLLQDVDPLWSENRIHGGIGSGEGIIWYVRDPIIKGEKLLEDGVEDKRLLLLESEFAQPLAVIQRQGNTTSEILRRAWDGTTLQTLTKNTSARATDAHISMIGHVTREELTRHLSDTEIANGLANRFIFCCAKRSKVLPDGGGSMDHGQLSSLIGRLREAITFARQASEMKRSDAARELWRDVYPELSDGKPGLLGAVTSRSEAQVLRLSMVYALLDSSAEIRCDHLRAALAVWRYAEDSACFIFGDRLGDPVADEILRALRGKPEGLTRSEVRDLFGRHRSESEIGRALGILLQYHLADFRSEATGGRPVERWFVHIPECDKSAKSDQTGV